MTYFDIRYVVYCDGDDCTNTDIIGYRIHTFLTHTIAETVSKELEPMELPWGWIKSTYETFCCKACLFKSIDDKLNENNHEDFSYSQRSTG